MAQVKTLVGEKVLIQIETDVPGTFAHPCLINAERAIQISSDVSDFVVPDCINPGTPGWKEIFKDGISITVSGGGMLHTTDLETYFGWSIVDTAKAVRIRFDVSAEDGGGHIAVPMKLTQFGISGDRKKNTTVDITLQSHGPAVWVDAV